MSWGNSAAGTAEEVKEQIAGWAAAVEKTDRQYNSEGIIRLHQEQVQKCTSAITSFVDAAPEGYLFKISANGHASETTTAVTSDQWSVSLSASMLVPVVASAA